MGGSTGKEGVSSHHPACAPHRAGCPRREQPDGDGRPHQPSQHALRGVTDHPAVRLQSQEHQDKGAPPARPTHAHPHSAPCSRSQEGPRLSLPAAWLLHALACGYSLACVSVSPFSLRGHWNWAQGPPEPLVQGGFVSGAFILSALTLFPDKAAFTGSGVLGHGLSLCPACCILSM